MPEIKRYLSRDGLEEYNSLLPHSSGEMQEYVNDWLDEHPEATTTVQDGAITEHKLADKSVSLRTLADDTVHMLKGMILTQEISGKVLTADDAYSAPPMAFTVEGKSTQDGTPTPDAPVEINNIEQIELNFVGKNLIQLTNVPVTKTERGITSTWDGTSLKATGEQSQQNAQLVYVEIPFCVQLEAEKRYTFSLQGIYQGPTVTTLYLRRNDDTQLLAYAYTAGKWTIIPSYDFTITGFLLRIGASSGYVNIDARPMLELGTNATPYEPYNATNILLNLTHALRSLPNGTHDTLSFTYLRPSTREGWAWYSRKLTTAIGRYDVNAFRSISSNIYQAAILEHRIPANQRVYMGIYTGAGSAKRGMSNMFTAAQTSSSYLNPNHFLYYTPSGALIFAFESGRFADLAAANAWLAENPLYVLMQLTTPTTTILDPIELPFTAAPDFTIWSDPNTGLQMEYVRDSNLVIQRIEQAIADQ